MNKAKLKSYAPQARLDFIAAVTARANLLGLSEKAGQLEVAPVQTQGDVALIAGQAWPAKVATQREQLIARMRREGFGQTCEAVAYTWFNRFAALRYMELHDYLGHGHRALSSAEGGLPDILTYASDLAHPGDTGLPGLKAVLVTEMKLAGNRDSELYRMLLVAQCNALSHAMPFLFERIDDDSELLLPDNLLRSDSIVAKLVEEIPEEDWAEVEIIGWLYQFYISDKKDQVIGKVVKSEDIPAATQLFTPNWIVQYLVQNSVGRLWLMANPSSTLASEWPYYITPGEQTSEVRAQLDALIQTRVREDGDTLNPESITVLDPACGSGHILVVAYNALKSIYLERGYQPRAIPRLILEKNLFGIDIDDRAAQMAGFALMMKARSDDRRLFNESVKLNVLSLRESKGLDAANLTQALQAILDIGGMPSIDRGVGSEFVSNDLFPESHLQTSFGESTQAINKNNELKLIISELVSIFSDAKTFGSLITVPKQLSKKLLWIEGLLNLAKQKGDLYAKSAAEDLIPLISQAKILTMQFDAVIANPPYMGNKYLAPNLKSYLSKYYKGFDKDLFSAFIIRDLSFAKDAGQLGFMTPFVWMFISTYDEMRKYLIDEATLTSLIQLEYSGFDGATVPICAFTLSKRNFVDFEASYVRLSEFKGPDQQGPRTLEAIKNPTCSWFHKSKPDDFKKIPGSPIAFWISQRLRKAFAENPSIGSLADTRKGMATGDNNRFVRLWSEVSFQKIGLNLSRTDALVSEKKWFPYANGGNFRKWSGNIEDIVLWENDGQVLQTELHESGRIRAVNMNLEYIFKPGLTWTSITSSSFSARYMPKGCLFSSAANSLFTTEDKLLPMLGELNSKVFAYLSKAVNPTLNMNPGDTGKIPFPQKLSLNNPLQGCISRLVEISNEDWESYEISWNFSRLPWILRDAERVNAEIDWHTFRKASQTRIEETIRLEEENNQVFIDIYGLDGEVSSEVSLDQVTLTHPDREKDCQRFVSYAIGCMMGRYSLDETGLIYAQAGNDGFESSRYKSFSANADGILPITDELWFDEDASNRIRQFLLVVWGVDTIEENMAWLAESLGVKPGETSDETIRRYITDKFFKDHLQAYKKRPIYWLFSSGKQGAFQALVYLHRYNEGTLARVRAEYVVPLMGKMQSRIEMLEKDANIASGTATRNKLSKEVEKLKKKYSELLIYDEQLRHYADMRITLDLDDGVKVNYGKFGNLLAEVKVITGGVDDE